ncbi:MAG: M24 family metallopeptidase, partial [Chloroflexota bacterium]
MAAVDTTLIQEKVAQATQILNELGVDLWLTFARESSMNPDPVLELIGVDVTWHSAFLLSRKGNHQAIIGYYDAENVRELGAYATVIDYHEGIRDHLLAALRQYDPQTIALNYSENDVSADGLSHGLYRTLRGYLHGTPYLDRLMSAEQIIAAVRGRKSQTEIERVRRAIETTESLFHEAEQFARPGLTQRQIAAFVQNRVDEMGLDYAWPKPFNPIVTCGPHSAVGHAAPGDVVLERGHLLQMDLGIRQNGYCSDLQR